MKMDDCERNVNRLYRYLKRKYCQSFPSIAIYTSRLWKYITNFIIKVIVRLNLQKKIIIILVLGFFLT